MKLFNTVQGKRVKSSNFDLSHEHRLSADFGKLYPILVKEVLPGDTWNMKTELITRAAPMICPPYHRVYQYVHSFYVPIRLLWDGYEKFFSGDPTATAPPRITTGVVGPGELSDHLGIPPGTSLVTNPVSALPYMAYNKIWNDYYRDQNLQEERKVKNLANSDFQDRTLAYRAWEKDYFTSALPFAQKFADIRIPVQNTVQWADPSRVDESPGGTNASGNLEADGQGRLTAGGAPSILRNIEEIDTLLNINDFRVAHRLQRWFETQARAGSRYFETLLGQFGVKTDDLRLSRPEYLGGSKSVINISEVLQTSATSQTETPQGNMAGHGISVGDDGGFKKHFKEHGFIMSILSYRPVTAYHQGLDKMWTRQDVFDYAWPELANLGEQEVLNQEIFVQGAHSDYNVFGYQSRYAEYKYASGRVAGDMRPGRNRDEYTMTRHFGISGDDNENNPVLNSDFVTCKPTYLNNRVFAAGKAGGDPFWTYVYFSIIARRPLPYYGTPTI